MPWQPAAAVASSAAPAVPRAARTAVAVVVSAKGNAMSDSKKGCLWHGYRTPSCRFLSPAIVPILVIYCIMVQYIVSYFDCY